MRERIRGYADAVAEETSADDAASAALARDLDGVVDVLGTSDDLRLVLGDPGVAVHARRGVLAELFRDRIGSEALRLLDYTVEADRAPDLVDNVAWLAERAAAARDGRRPAGAGILGHHAALERVDGYATAVLATVRGEQGLDDVEDDLFRFERIVAGSAELTEVLTGRELGAEARRALVVDLLQSRAAPATVRLAAYATTVGRPRDYLALLDALVSRVAAEGRRRVAEVRAAVDLTDEQQSRLAAALSRMVGQRVEVRVVVDRSVLGGFVATIGDTVVDGSTRHRLDLLKERLVVSPEATSES